MKFDLKSPPDKQKFKELVNSLYQNEDFVELKKIFPVRSNQQMRYAHLIFSFIGMEMGETKEYVKKKIYKAIVNRDLFRVEEVNEDGEIEVEYKSINDLDSKELNHSLERFRQYFGRLGINIPEPNEKEWLMQIEKDIEAHKDFL